MSPLAALLLLAAHDGPKIDDFVQPRLHDASFTARVEKGDQNELAKINKDFGQAYRFQFTNVKVKEPFKLRLETNVEDTEITYVINGARQMYWIPKARIHISKDFSSEPGRRQSALDFGLLTPSLFESLFDAA
ncbi:MAG: hypothetical protein HY248_04595, partial [Fimbriimonas ginsengisoli]|nr:hypothetical protein [Fimbriimonas ginsengisoli]